MKTLPSSAKLSAVAMGLWFGVLPIPGASTFVVLLALQALRHKGWGLTPAQATICLAVNMLATPLMLLCIPFWLNFGSAVFHLDHCKPSEIVPAFQESPLNACSQFTGCIVAATITWCIVTPFTMFPFLVIHRRYLTSYPIRPEDRVPLIDMQADDEGNIVVIKI